jgi:glycosyltransferase involved in cell wall biosynthesis
MKRVLFVDDLHPAVPGVPARRSAKLAKYLADNGWEAITLHDHFGGLLASTLGDSALGQRAAVRAAKKLFRKVPYDAVFATGSVISLTVGRAIAAATTRPLIVDIHEPCCSDADVITAAAAVVCRTDGMRQLMSNMHPSLDEDRFVAIHDGFDRDDLEEPAPDSAAVAFCIVYTGGWSDDHTPRALYSAIDWIRRSDPSALDGIDVVAAGFKPGEARLQGLSRYIREIGDISHREALGLMQSAQLVYLADSDERHWEVPAVLYEAVAGGTPVVVRTHPESEAARMLRRLGGGKVVCPDDPGELYYALLDACRTKTVRVPDRDEAALATVEWRTLSAKLAAVMDEAATRKSEVIQTVDIHRETSGINSALGSTIVGQTHEFSRR